MPAYIISVKPFISVFFNIYIFLNELLVCIFYIILGLPLVFDIQISKKEMTSIAIIILLIALLLNVLLNCILLMVKIINFIRKRRKAKLQTVMPSQQTETYEFNEKQIKNQKNFFLA